MALLTSIKQNRILYSWFWKAINRMPRPWIYPADYFHVCDLLAAHDRNADIDGLLRQRLARILRTALETVPYYRDLRLEIDPRDITPESALEALGTFPYVDKKTIMDDPRAFVSGNYNVNRLMVDTSGGSTGQGVTIYTTGRQKFIEIAFSFYEWEKCGWRPTSRVIRIGTDARKPKTEDPFTVIGDRLLISPFHLTETWLPLIYERCVRFQAEFFHAYPSCMFQLTQYLREQQLGLPRVKGIFLYSEEVSPSAIAIMREVFPGVPILIQYGLSEKTNLAWGHSANGKIRYVLNPVYGFSENRLDCHGHPELVGTSYWNDVMPLIRYRTQDYGLIRDGVMERIDGRASSFLLTKQGAVVPGTPLDIDPGFWRYVDALQIIQDQPGRLLFHVVPRGGFSERVRRELLESVHRQWGDCFDVHVIPCASAHRTAGGKQPMIISRVNARTG